MASNPDKIDPFLVNIQQTVITVSGTLLMSQIRSSYSTDTYATRQERYLRNASSSEVRQSDNRIHDQFWHWPSPRSEAFLQDPSCLLSLSWCFKTILSLQNKIDTNLSTSDPLKAKQTPRLPNFCHHWFHDMMPIFKTIRNRLSPSFPLSFSSSSYFLSFSNKKADRQATLKIYSTSNPVMSLTRQRFPVVNWKLPKMAAKRVAGYRSVMSRTSDVIRAFDWPARLDELVNPTERGVENQRAVTVSECLNRHLNSDKSRHVNLFIIYQFECYFHSLLSMYFRKKVSRLR